MNLDNIKIDSEHLENTIINREYNKKIIEYYNYFLNHESFIPFSKEVLERKRDNLSNCNKIWILDYYKNLNIKKIHKIHLCKDKFCNNCKKVVQASRMAKYIPMLESYSDTLYHFTLTVPNVPGGDLHMTIKKMANCFKRLIVFLSGRKNIKGIDFLEYGYEGAIRSLEITYKNGSYHPHYHCAISFKNLNLDKFHINNFSYNYKSGIKQLNKLFSDFEILMQKIWYLLYNGETVNIKNINSLELGYSCNIDKFNNNDYAELFKYMTKGTDENNNLIQYNDFVTLLYSTYRVKQIQGYGVFYNVNDEGDCDSLVETYNSIIEYLESVETPIRIYEFTSSIDRNKILENLINKNLDFESFKKVFGVVDISKSTYISLKKFMLYMKNIS